MASINLDTLSSFTDYEIQEITEALTSERHRRKGEKKLPMYVVGGRSMKSLHDALVYLKVECDKAIYFERSPEMYFGDKTVGGVDQTLLELRVEFWNKLEYDARPDVVWG